MTIVIIGSDGQLGSELVTYCQKNQIQYIPFTHKTLEITNKDQVHECLKHMEAGSVVINTAAYHDLEKCELHPEIAWDVNANGVRNLAYASVCHGFKFVQISTDYVYSKETDINGLPISVYAKSKLSGEIAALLINSNSLIVRLGTLYGKNGCKAKNHGNFINTVVEKINTGDKFTLPCYTSLRTTSAKHATRRIMKNLNTCGVKYANDTYAQMSHYDIGSNLCNLLGKPNLIQAVSKDPTDTIRPKTMIYSHETLSLNVYAYEKYNPLQEYLKEKGYIN